MDTYLSLTPRKPRSQEVKRIIEALLFSTENPLSIEKIRDILIYLQRKEIKAVIEELASDYTREKKGLQIVEAAEGYLICTTEEMRPYIEQLFQDRRGDKLSKAATEVLAIVAYKQPITRAQIESIRGVDCSGTLSSLLERSLVMHVGRAEVPGRPPLYGTTKRFLQHYGLKSLEELKR